MIILEKHFEDKPNDRELGEFISNFVFLKGYAKMDVIYNEEENPLYIKFKIYEDKLNGWKLANTTSNYHSWSINCNANLLFTSKKEESSTRRIK